MQLGMVGLGRMGANMTERLQAAGHDMKTFDTNVEGTASSLEELVQQLDAPRSVWLMIPAGIVDSVLDELAPHLEKGDTIIDGGNSYYVDDLRRAAGLLRDRDHRRGTAPFPAAVTTACGTERGAPPGMAPSPAS